MFLGGYHILKSKGPVFSKTEAAVIRWGKHPPQRVGWIQVTIGSGKNAIPTG